MASGDCSEDRTDCDKIFAELAYWQEVVRSNAARFRAALNWPSSKELSIRMIFEDRELLSLRTDDWKQALAYDPAIA